MLILSSSKMILFLNTSKVLFHTGLWSLSHLPSVPLKSLGHPHAPLHLSHPVHDWSSDFSHTFKKASQALSILIGISFSTIRLLAFFKGFWKTSDAVCQERFWEAHSRICTTRVWTLGMTPHLPQVPWNHENFTGCLQPVEQIKMQVANGCPNGESHGSTFHFEQTKGDFDAQFQQFSSWKLVKLVTQQEHPHAINSLTFCLTSLARSHRSHRSHRSRFTRPSLSSATPNNLDVIGDTSQNASFLESQNK